MKTEIERYLFVEMTDKERDAFEERMFADDALFVEVMDDENRLVDDYLAGSLSETSTTRFERSLDLIPATREKLANARSLSEFIDESRAAVTLPEKQPSFLERVGALFVIRSPMFGFGAAAIALLLIVVTGLLIVRDQRTQAELARVTELEQRLEESRRREQELRSTVESERETSGDVVDELDRERARREQIERELTQLSQRRVEQRQAPVIASVFLMPVGGRGGQGDNVRTVKIGPETRHVSLRLALPEEIGDEERLSVNLNQRRVASGLKPRVAGGNKTLSITLEAKSVRAGKNQLDVFDEENREVNSYSFDVQR